MASTERPLSPHLQIYSWRITNTLSILHRLTGLALSVGALLVVYWLVAVASGPADYARAQEFLGSPLVQVLLLGWTVCFFYHLGNGIRHLAWDAGWGFDLPVARVTGWLVVVFAVVMTALAWWPRVGGA